MNDTIRNDILSLASHIESLGDKRLARNTRLVIRHPETARRRMWCIAVALDERHHFAPVTTTRYGQALATATRIAETLDALEA